MTRVAVRAAARTPDFGGSTGVTGPHRVRRPRRSLRGDTGPELPPPHGTVRPSPGPADGGQSGDPAPPKARVTARRSATCGTVSAPRGPARTAVRAAPTPARSGGRVRWRRRVPRPGRVVPGGAPRPGPHRWPRSDAGGAPRPGPQRRPGAVAVGSHPGRHQAERAGGTARPRGGRGRWRRWRSRSSAKL